MCMEDRIELNSRRGEQNYLQRLKTLGGGQSLTYVLKTSSNIVRNGTLPPDNRPFIDPLGGPKITVGSFLAEAGTRVKYIDFVMGIGYTITFESDINGEK